MQGNVQRQKEVAEEGEVEATFATAATGFYFVSAASLGLIIILR